MSRRSIAAVAVLAFAGIAILLFQHAPSRTGLRVVVVGIDGASHKILFPMMKDGRLPNLGAFLGKAGGGLLDSPIDKYESAALWTSIVTGVDPKKHGITDFVLPPEDKNGPLLDRPKIAASSGHRRTKALWNLLDDAGLRSTIVGLWATWPAEPIDGIMVTDRVTYSRLRLSKTFKEKGGGEVAFQYDSSRGNYWPRDFGRAVDRLGLVRLPDDVEPALLKRFAPFTDAEVAAIKSGRFEGSFNEATDSLQELKLALQSDRSYVDITHAASRFYPTDLTFLYLEGVDVMEHKFFQYHAGLKSAEPELRGKYSDVLRTYYEATDRWIGDFLALASKNTVVIVVSDHGYDAAPPAKPGEKQEHEHWHDRNSVFFARGGPIKEGATLNPGRTLVDVTPTILALLGQDVATDLDGHVMTELFDENFLKQHPVRSIDSYGPRIRDWYPTSGSDDDQALVDRLKQLGYMGGPEEQRRPARKPDDAKRDPARGSNGEGKNDG